MGNQSPIFKLPPEIRLVICDFAVIQRVTGSRFSPDSGFTRSLIPPNLARVNRKLRQEVIPEYYRKNEFWIELPVIKDRLHDKFLAQCRIAVDFLPLIRSLRCEAYLIPAGDWSVVFQNPANTTTNEETRLGLVDWGDRIAGREAFWDMMQSMVKFMTLEQLYQYTDFVCRLKPKGQDSPSYLSISAEFRLLANQCVLGMHPVEAVFCQRS
ncbi:hypothetical protein F5Y10DRAFT_293300 [Nemania abortiva]|nr:hypothetical protein F5Y10DRAFT_293300 [Nemania abortiva]